MFNVEYSFVLLFMLNLCIPSPLTLTHCMYMFYTVLSFIMRLFILMDHFVQWNIEINLILNLYSVCINKRNVAGVACKINANIHIHKVILVTVNWYVGIYGVRFPFAFLLSFSCFKSESSICFISFSLPFL